MTNIKIALTNLGKYNEGELVYKWVELPASEEELTAALEEIGVNEQYEEFFISDYEAPLGIEVGEYENIEKLNEFAELLEGIEVPEKKYGRYDTGDVLNFAHELEDNGLVPDAYYYIGDIVDDEQLNEMAKAQADNSWQRVAHFLAGIEYMNEDYYWINGYANAENLTNDRLEGIVSDLVDELRNAL